MRLDKNDDFVKELYRLKSIEHGRNLIVNINQIELIYKLIENLSFEIYNMAYFEKFAYLFDDHEYWYRVTKIDWLETIIKKYKPKIDAKNASEAIDELLRSNAKP